MKAEKMSFSNEEIGRIERFAFQRLSPVLTVVMTDIVGSVIKMQEMGEIAYRKLKAEHHDRPIFEIINRDNKGSIIKNRGDGFMFVFAEPSVAVERALEIQQYFREHGHFQVRIGIAMGQCVLDCVGIPDIISMHANIAARAESLCAPGHILVTISVFESASGWIPKSQSCWKNHGFWAVKYGEDFHEYVEPYNKNTTVPMSKLKGTQSCVPTFENVGVFLNNALIVLFKEVIYFFRCLVMLICFFAKKNNTKLPPLPLRSNILLYTAQGETGIHDKQDCYSENEAMNNSAVCLPVNHDAPDDYSENEQTDDIPFYIPNKAKTLPFVFNPKDVCLNFKCSL